MISPNGTLVVGKKGRSGRLSVADEALKNRVKHKAWLLEEAEMDKQHALQIVLRDMTVKVNSDSNIKIAGLDLEEIIKYANSVNKGLPQNKVTEQEIEDLSGGNVGQ